MEVVSTWLNKNNTLDRKLYQHIKHVVSKSIFEIKSKGMNERGFEVVGKLLFRLYRVIQVYKKKRKRTNLIDTLNEVEKFAIMFVSDYTKGSNL